MFKNIVLVIIIGALGYLAAMVFPPPASWQANVNNLIGGSESLLSDNDSNTNSNSSSEQGSAQENTNPSDNDNANDSEQQSDETLFVQQDLLFSPVNSVEQSTLVLGAFTNSELANHAIAQINLQNDAEQHAFKLPTGTEGVLVTIGKYDSLQAATKAKLDIEAFHNINLQLAKYPEKAPPEKDENAQMAENLIEVLQSLQSQ